MFSFEHMILVLLKFEDLLCYAWHKQVFNGQAALGSMVVACPELLYMYVQKFLQFVAIFSFVKFNLHACIT